jgi:hypothetical protein
MLSRFQIQQTVWSQIFLVAASFGTEVYRYYCRDGLFGSLIVWIVLE